MKSHSPMTHVHVGDYLVLDGIVCWVYQSINVKKKTTTRYTKLTSPFFFFLFIKQLTIDQTYQLQLSQEIRVITILTLLSVVHILQKYILV